MYIKNYVNEKKQMYEKLQIFISSTSDQDNFSNLYQIINIQADVEEFRLFLHLIGEIAKYYHADSQFFRKIEQILAELKEFMKQTFSNHELFNIFKGNKRIILFLLESDIITIDESIFKEILDKIYKENENQNENGKDFIFDDYSDEQGSDILESIYSGDYNWIEREFEHDDNEEEDDYEDEDEFYITLEEKNDEREPKKRQTKNKDFLYFFYPEIKGYLNAWQMRQIEKKLNLKIGQFTIDEFKEKRKIGENGSYICELIRQDSIEEFVSYVTRTNYSINSQVPHSIFETNSFLVKNDPSLIEYAAFFGSIQIIRYLQFNKVILKPSLWMYAIHSNNAELIHFLEENHVQPPENNYDNCLEESIKCHHNDIAQYIYENLMDYKSKINDLQNNFDHNFLAYCFRYYNFGLWPEEMSNHFIFFYLCKYNYFNLVKLFVNEMNIDLNSEIEINVILYKLS
ncbi:hypothetical protein M9Y10_023705 [Tritrichomonas musculus]|uniref:DUF3447 domain-containing protein n=1 Tax=Tritrichomonas musculus TaxID=1915356 RepID=A0ABR2KWN3_9EUKA